MSESEKVIEQKLVKCFDGKSYISVKEDSSHTFCQFERGDFEVKFNGQTQVHKLTKLFESSILQQGYKLLLYSNDVVLFIQ